jgi:hypothetical protein
VPPRPGEHPAVPSRPCAPTRAPGAGHDRQHRLAATWPPTGTTAAIWSSESKGYQRRPCPLRHRRRQPHRLADLRIPAPPQRHRPLSTRTAITSTQTIHFLTMIETPGARVLSRGDQGLRALGTMRGRRWDSWPLTVMGFPVDSSGLSHADRCRRVIRTRLTAQAALADVPGPRASP